VETTWPDVRIYAHLTREHVTLYIDTSGSRCSSVAGVPTKAMRRSRKLWLQP